MEVIGQGGKATSSLNKDYFNVKNSDDQTECGMHLDQQTWRFDNVSQTDTGGDDIEEAMVVMIPAKDQGTPECSDAKLRELKGWEEFGAVEEVEDKGQETISHRWVLVEKMIKGKLGIKARLVVRGFEEAVQVQADSPTGRKESLHLLLSLASTYGWEIKTLDVQNAYLQGEDLDREVYMEPPPEANKSDKIWRLRKAVYGMNDAGRRWFFRVRTVLKDMGWSQCKLDSCFFYTLVGDVLHGVVILWVDDFFFACNPSTEKSLVDGIEKQFKIGNKEVNDFVYTGLRFTRLKSGIEVDQSRYIDTLEPAVLSRKSPKIMALTKEESTLLRKMTGKINWAATQTRPDMAYSVVELSVKYKAPTLEDLTKANKAIMRMVANPVKLFFPALAGQFQIITFSDAAFRNLPDQISSGRGHIIFLRGSDSGDHVAPVAWNANKVKRVVGSTIAAEGLSLLMALDHAHYLRAILAEVLGKVQKDIQIVSYIDSKNLYEAIYSTSLVEDKKLRCDLAQIQETVNTENVEVKWVPGSEMLADSLTKKTANSAQLLNVLSRGLLKVII